MPQLPIETALVGRGAESAALAVHLDAAAEGSGSIVLLTGVPGIGKSRLAIEIRDRATLHGMTTLWGRGFEGEAAPTFGPWVEVLGGYARGLRRRQLQRQLGDDAPLVLEIVPAIRDLLGHSAAPITSQDGDRDRLFDAVVRFVLRAARSRPLLLVLDDVHWADRSSLALLRHLARHLTTSRVLVVCSYRAEEVGPSHPLSGLVPILKRETACYEIALEELSPDESTDLAVLLLQTATGMEPAVAIEPELEEALVTHGAGNPFYLQELLRHLIETHQIVLQHNRWTAKSTPSGWDIPREVRAVIERRVAGLPLPAQHLLRAACACTSGFRFAEAQALTELDDEMLLDAIDAALHARLVCVADPDAISARYDFSHALIRQALYANLNPDRRARLHLRTAQALERGQASDELAVALAMHYRLAGRFAAPERAIDYAIRAGELARSSFAYEEAVHHWELALRLMEERGAAPVRRAGILERLADQLFMTDPASPRAIACHEQALTLYEQAHHREGAARVHWQLARLFASFLSERQDVPRALRHAKATRRLSPPTAPIIERVFVQDIFALLRWYRLEVDEASAASQRGMDWAAASDDDHVRFTALFHRVFCLAAAGQLAASERLMDDAYEIANRLNQPFVACAAAVWGASIRRDLLDPGDACRWLERELAEPRSARAPVQRQLLAFFNAYDRLSQGAVVEAPPELPAGGLFQTILESKRAFATGDWNAARGSATTYLDLTRRRGNRVWECRAMHQLARIDLAEDDTRSAADNLTRALGMVAGRHRPFEALLCADIALLYATHTRLAEARAAVHQCRESLPESEDWRGLRGRLALAEAAVAVGERQPALAERCFEQAVAIFRRYQLPWDEAQALQHWGAMHLSSGNRSAGDASFDAAATIYRRHGAGRAWLQRLSTFRAATPSQTARTLQAASVEPLSSREVEVLRLVAEGRSNQQIANSLALSVRTVERHLSQMYEKLGARGKPARAAAVAFGMASGLIQESTPHQSLRDA